MKRGFPVSVGEGESIYNKLLLLMHITRETVRNVDCP